MRATFMIQLNTYTNRILYDCYAVHVGYDCYAVGYEYAATGAFGSTHLDA